MVVFGFDMLFVIPSSIYFLTVYIVRRKIAYQKAYQREQRVQRAKEAKYLKW